MMLNSEIEDRKSHNVIATLPGESEETIIVAAHHDSLTTKGAVDDATGVAVVLETAQRLSDKNISETIKFISFGAEEYGLVGSRHYVRNHENEDILAALVIDSICPGPKDGLGIGLKGGSADTTPWLDEFVRGVAENMELDSRFETLSDMGGYSDYVSFTERGFAATWLYWVLESNGDLLWPVHTAADNMGNVDNSNLRNTADLVISSVNKLSGLDRDRSGLDRADRVSIFTIMSASIVSVGLAVFGYVRYSRERDDVRVFLVLIGIVIVAIVLIYFALF